MTYRKNLKNLGFTVFELLVVITIIGVIASMAIPITIVNQKKYNRMMFEQQCMLYEKVFLDTYNRYKYEYYGATPLTQNIKFSVPFVFKSEPIEDVFVDILDTTHVYYFIYETLYKSKFSYENYQIDYTPAEITARRRFFPSVYKLTIDNNVEIELHLLNFSSDANISQLVIVKKVLVRQNDIEYEFEV